MEEKVIEVESGGGQMTRSIRANKADFDALKEVAERLNMSQGAAFSQLLASWELHHASDTMQEQAGAVKAAQALLAQLENLFTGQFAAMSALEAEAKKAASAEVETLRRQLVAARDDEQAARSDVLAAQEAMKDARAAQRAAEKKQKEAEEAQAEASCKRKIAEDALAAVQSAAADARAERDKATAEAERLTQEFAALQEKAAGYDNAVAALDAEKAKVAELREELAAEKADRRKATNDLTELMKSVDARIDKAKAEAAKATKAELKRQYDQQYNDALKELREKADEEVKRRVAEARQEFESAQWAKDAEKLAEQDKPFEPKQK
jgi:colicin import membrane protein